MKKRPRTKRASDHIRVHGFFRVQIQENGKVVGDSGWRKNQVTNLGFDQFLCQTLAGAAGSKKVTHMGIGSGTAPGAADTTLASELNTNTYSRITVGTSTIASKTVQFTASWASSASHILAAVTVNNVGLFNTITSGTLFAGQTYTTSQWNTNQDLLASYQIRFS